MPPGISLIEVNTTSRRDVRRFIDLPFKLYQNCPQWVPPLIGDARLQLNRQKNPFYLRNDASFFIATRDGEDVGRICVMHPKYYNTFKGTSQAWFYLFECIDDQSVANALLDQAAGWARARSLTHFRGPLGFIAGDGFGMLVRGFEHRPAVGIPYNFDYYPRLVETWGFELEEPVYSGYVNLDVMRQTFPERVVEIAEKVKQRYGFETKTFKNKRELAAWAKPRMVDMYNRTLTHIAGDPPLAPEEVEIAAENLLLIADPKMIKFIVRRDDPDNVIGFLFCFVDISEGIQKARGGLFPFGWLHLLRSFRTTDWLNINGMGIVPEYQGMGGPAIMYSELFQAIRNAPQYKHADLVQISANNTKSLNEMKKFGADFYKQHNIYRRVL